MHLKFTFSFKIDIKSVGMYYPFRILEIDQDLKALKNTEQSLRKFVLYSLIYFNKFNSNKPAAIECKLFFLHLYQDKLEKKNNIKYIIILLLIYSNIFI